MLNRKADFLEALQKLPDYEQIYAEELSRLGLSYMPIETAIDLIIEGGDNCVISEYCHPYKEMYLKDSSPIDNLINGLTELKNDGYTNVHFGYHDNEVFLVATKKELKPVDEYANDLIHEILYFVQIHRYDLKYQIKQLQSRFENE